MSSFPRSDVTNTPSGFLMAIRSRGVVTGYFLYKLPIWFKDLYLVKQVRLVWALLLPDFLCNLISQPLISGPEFIILGFPCFQQCLIPQIHQVAYLRSDPGKGLASCLHLLSSRCVPVTNAIQDGNGCPITVIRIIKTNTQTMARFHIVDKF